MEEEIADGVNCLFLAIKEERTDIVRAVLESAGNLSACFAGSACYYLWHIAQFIELFLNYSSFLNSHKFSSLLLFYLKYPASS